VHSTVRVVTTGWTNNLKLRKKESIGFLRWNYLKSDDMEDKREISTQLYYKLQKELTMPVLLKMLLTI